MGLGVIRPTREYRPQYGANLEFVFGPGRLDVSFGVLALQVSWAYHVDRPTVVGDCDYKAVGENYHGS